MQTININPSDSYVRRIVRKYRVTTGEGSAAPAVRSRMLPIIREWAGEHFVRLIYSGSYAKGTAIRGLADVDLFVSLRSTTPVGLAEIYQNLYTFLQARGWNPAKRDVAIRVPIGELKVDVVPARRQHPAGQDHSLYRNRADTWVQTNVDRHIGYVKSSGRIVEICALKIWLALNGIDASSFPVEVAAIVALRGKPVGRPAANLRAVFASFSETLATVRLVDPANTNNIVSDALTMSEKSKIATAAAVALTERNWEAILW